MNTLDVVQSRNQPNKHGGKKGEGGEWGRKKLKEGAVSNIEGFIK